MMSNQLRLHPALAAHYLYEELWHPNTAGYDDQSLIQYWDWLKRKYGTIEALNAEWGRTYKAFEDIVQPRRGKKSFWEYTPEFVNFRKFRGWAQVQMIRSADALVHRLEPEHISWAAKGDYATQSWSAGEYQDMFGWYSPYLAASVARHFGKAAIVGGYHLNCEYAYLDGRRQFDHKPGRRRYLGRKETAEIYNRLLASVFKGTKGFYVEWYSNGMCHAFHRTDLIRRDGPKFKIRHWTGQIAFFEPPAYQGPPVNMHRAALFASAANKLLLRSGHLWLPARPEPPKVLFPMTEASCFLTWFGAKPYADLEGVSMRILRSCNLAADFMSLPAVKDLSRYDLIVLSDLAVTLTRKDVERVRRYVAAGGKLILINAAGFSDDARPRRYMGRRDKDEVYPLEAFAEMGGYRLVAKNAWHMSFGKAAARFARCDVAPEFADGQTLGEYDVSFYYTPAAGSQVFLKGTVPGVKGDVALGVLNADRNVAVVNLPPKTAPDGLIHPLARWFRRLIDSWRIAGRVTLGGIDDAWDLYGGCLLGDGYTLAAACNFRQNQTCKTDLKLRGLPAGQYAVIDITGDRPELVKAADGGWRHKSDPAARRLKIDHRLSARQLAEKGVACRIAPGQARALLLRPLAEKVWVSIWPPALAAFARRPVTIAHGTAPEDRSGAETLRAALAKAGAKVAVSPAADVKRRKLRHEVRVNPFGSTRQARDDISKWYLMDVFNNEPIDSDHNILLVGSEATNSLLKHLAAEGTFAYDKVLEKITPDYPGPGRGVIGWIDAVNFPTYDLRSQARDAVYVGGSDAAGTRAAVARLADLVARHARRAPAKPPAATAPGG